MPTVYVHAAGATRSVDEDFLDWVLADEQLLRAEFDAIIAQEWPASPPPAAPRPTGREGGPQPQRRQPPRRASASGERTRHPRARRWRRQRSPPPAAAHSIADKAEQERQVITPHRSPLQLSNSPYEPLAWAAFMPSRQTHRARRPRLNGVPVRDPGEARHSILRPSTSTSAQVPTVRGVSADDR
jgi:hypothetical protein